MPIIPRAPVSVAEISIPRPPAGLFLPWAIPAHSKCTLKRNTTGTSPVSVESLRGLAGWNFSQQHLCRSSIVPKSQKQRKLSCLLLSAAIALRLRSPDPGCEPITKLSGRKLLCAICATEDKRRVMQASGSKRNGLGRSFR